LNVRELVRLTTKPPDEVARDFFGLQTDPDFLAGNQIESILKLIQTCIMTHLEDVDQPDGSCSGGPYYKWGPKTPPPSQVFSQGFGNRRLPPFKSPKRLVFVGGYPEYPEPRLIETSELPQMTDVTEGSPHLDLRYVAYSHCWGDPANGPMTTTPDTLLQRKSGIPLDTLPRSFQDLILVARKLGIAYVWIDSLCIIQGSHGDFFEQASQMGDIYRASYLTVISASAKSAHAGFLQRRPKAFMKYNIQELNAQRPLYLEPFNLSLGSLKSECLWAERGWTYQEEYLSIRRLYFFPNNLVYECNSKGWFSEGVEIDRFRQDDSARVWNSSILTTIGSFSSRNFTKFEDKVAAFAGIAKHMELAQSERYLSSPVRNGQDQLWMRSFYGQKDHRIHRNYIVSRSTGSCHVGPDGPKFLAGDPDLHAGLSLTQLAASLLWANTVVPAKNHTTENGVIKGPSFSWMTVAAPVSFTIPVRKPNESAQMRVHMYGQALPENHPGVETFDPFVNADGAFIRGHWYGLSIG
jgi:Heterokaryon incompatibility protein (HET)